MTRDKSNKTTVIVSVVIALILSTLAVEAEKDVSEECKKLGFDTKNLLCQDCDLFFEVTKDNGPLSFLFSPLPFVGTRLTTKGPVFVCLCRVEEGV